MSEAYKQYPGINSEQDVDITATSAAVAAPDESGALEHLFTLQGREEVWDFLDRYPFLVPLILEARAKILEQDYFPTATVWLEVSIDPEETSSIQLLLSIVTDLEVEEADTRMQRFIADWWIDAIEQAQGKLCIILSFL